MTRVLVAGAAGFIGRHMVERLLAETDWEVIGIARSRPCGPVDNPRLYWVHADLARVDAGSLGRLVGDVDYVVNLAAEADAARSLRAPLNLVANNLSSSGALLEYARERDGVRRFIQVSSGEVFGTSPLPHFEDAPVRPETPYAASKAAQDALALSYREAYGVPVLVSHTSNVFGEGQPPTKLLPVLVRHIMDGRVALDVIPGERTFIHAEDCAAAWLWLLEHADDEWTHCNVAGEFRVGHDWFARTVARAAGMPDMLVNVGGTGRVGQRGDVLLDGTRLAGAGWKHPVGVLAGIERTVAALLAGEAK